MNTASISLPATARDATLRRLPLITLYLSERCNSRCAGCDYWRHGRVDAQLESVIQLLPGLAALRTQCVLISGGEPLLNRHWAQIATLLRSRGLALWLLTSGLSLSKNAARVAQLFDTVTVSLDGASRQSYRITRGVDAFNVVCRGIASVASMGIAPTVRVTVQRANFRELATLVELARQLGAGRISFLAADVSNATAFGRQGLPQDNMALTVADLPEFAHQIEQLCNTHAQDFNSGFIAESPAKLRRLLQYYQALRGLAPYPQVRCNAPEFSAVIEAAGRVRPCFFIAGPADEGRPFDLPATVNAPRMTELRAAIHGGERDECHRCVCSMWRDPDGAQRETLA